jgi:ABC-2 type transport system permease protein
VPLAVMTTFPARAILGKLDAGSAVGALGASVALLLVSRVVWRGAIGRYTSAGG